MNDNMNDKLIDEVIETSADDKSQKRINKKVSKAKLCLVLAGLILVFAAVLYYVVHYHNYNVYKTYLSSYSAIESYEFEPIADTSKDVEGMVLVAENEYLKLYTNTNTAEVAVYDKRNKSVTYTNPYNRENDAVANETNMNYLNSQIIVEYFNAARNAGTLDSYTASAQNGTYRISSIENGVKYTYLLLSDSCDKSDIDENTDFEAYVADAKDTCFLIDVEYQIDGDSLNVTVPMCNVREGGGSKLYRIQLLRYMGAGSMDENGYMLVPNGSGSLIYFNNGKSNHENYSQYVYGIDPLSQDYTTVENALDVRLPVYGISKDSSNVFVRILDGASLSFITASQSGKVNSYNYIYPTFVLRGYDSLSMFGAGTTASDLPLVEPEFYDVNISVRYSFMDDKHQGYAGMANYYRDKLIEEKVFSDRIEGNDIPLFYDVIGGVKKTSHVLGIKTFSIYPMTTFDEAEYISNDLKSRGINNQILNYEGWFNGGYYHDAPDKVKVIDKLGGKNGLNKLESTVKTNGGVLYADVAFQNMSDIAKGYIPSFEASRYYGAGYVASFGRVNPANLRRTASLGYKENIYTVLSPKFLPRHVDKFIKQSSGISIDGYSLRDMGNEIVSDRRRTNIISREESLDVVKAQFDKFAETDKKIMVRGGNDYTFSYASAIVDAPINDNNFIITDADVPFYEMVIHGYIDYAGYDINTSALNDKRMHELNMIEYAASPHFVFTMKSATEMKYTALNRYYATTYGNWCDEAADTYEYVNGALKNITGATVINHEILSDSLRRITYDNNKVIYVNYGNEDIDADGITVKAMDYAICDYEDGGDSFDER